MLFTKYFNSLLLCFLAALSLASCAAAPNPAPAPVSQIDTRDLFSSFAALEKLLSGQSLTEINAVIHHAYLLLDDETTAQAKGLLAGASALLTPQFVNQTVSLITVAGKLLPGLAKAFGVQL